MKRHAKHEHRNEDRRGDEKRAGLIAIVVLFVVVFGIAWLFPADKQRPDGQAVVRSATPSR